MWPTRGSNAAREHQQKRHFKFETPDLEKLFYKTLFLYCNCDSYDLVHLH